MEAFGVLELDVALRPPPKNDRMSFPAGFAVDLLAP